MRSRHRPSRLEHRHRAVQHLVAENSTDGCLRLPQRHFCFRSPDNRQPPKRHVVLPIPPARRIADSRRHSQRQPNVVVASRRDTGESLFSHSHDRHRDAVHLNRPSDRIASAAKRALPVAVIQHRNRSRRRRIVARLQYASRGCLHAERAKEISGDHLSADYGRGTIARQIQPPCVGKRSHSRKHFRLLHLAKHGLGQRAPRRIRFPVLQIGRAVTR